ncbi:unnamed protein product, partial [Closterium sp. NIES-53]
TFVQECQTAWGQTIAGWSGASPQCTTATGLTCDASGFILSLKLHNYKLAGQIPNSVSNLKMITYLDLASNQLPGSIPATVTALSLLRYFWLYNNTLTGPIPTDIGSMTSLVSIILYTNTLSGSVPPSISKLTGLMTLIVAGNRLSGPIPADIGLLTRLTTIDLSTNQFSGSIPASVSALAQASVLYLYSNQLTGSIPDEIGYMTKLSVLSLRVNMLSGSLPASITKLTALTFLYLYDNRLSGSIPTEIGSMTRLAYLSLASNQLTGSIPNIGVLTKLVTIDLSGNQLSGSVPASVSALTSLTALYLYSNQLSGSIPAEIGSMTGLSYLDLSDNQLSGSIPASLSGLTRLAIMVLSNNQLSDSIPASLSALTKLIYLSLYTNQLTSSIPAEVGSLESLTVLYLHKNQLNGSIPANIGSLTSLASVYLYSNMLSGSLPSSTTKLTALTSLVLDNNQLTGSIPSGISSLSRLAFLSLSRNQLYGLIPDSIGSLTKLSSIALNSNKLYGRIPVSFSKLTHLTFLNLSSNYLASPISLPTINTLRLSSNFFYGSLPNGACQALNFNGNCFALPSGCAEVVQRQEAACNAFCGVSSAAAAAPCGGRGVCVPDEKETGGKFTAAPVPLFVYGAGQAVSGCGVQLAFQANFTFSLSPQSGRVGNNGFAFVISATDRMGNGSGVGYGGMDSRSMAVEFDTTVDKLHGDMSIPHVGLNIQGQDRSIAAVKSPFELTNRNAYTAWVDYEPGEPGTIQMFLAATEVKPQVPLLERRLALCEVLQAGAEQQAFFFGFVASTTVKPFQMHLILKSGVHTGLPAPRKPVDIIPAFGLTLSVVSYAPVGASPFMRYMSADYRVLANQQSAWQVSGSHSWDSMPFLGWPVKNQDDCSASWAYAVVASVEAAYGIALNSEAPRLSVDSLFAAMGLTSLTAKCMAGGSPAAAFDRLLTLPSGGLTTDSKPISKYPIQGFERTRFKGYVGLMLAVRRQPVVVHIEASSTSFVQYDGTFKYRDPACYTGNLDHAVLVVGYLLFTINGRPSETAPPFWIIRNSWGVEWGDRGHMRMDIQGGDGVCGINVLPGIYPIVKIPKDPCGQKSYKGNGDLQPSMNPCGRFTCQANTNTNSNTCNCTIPNETKQPFVEVPNGSGSNTCAYVDVCSSYSSNPCAVGTCINDGKGAYSCICPPNYVGSITVDNLPTCDPANTTASVLKVTGVNWWCSDVFPVAGVSLAGFALQNMGINCSQPLSQGKVIGLGSATPCTAYFYALKGDTCSSISVQLGLASTYLASLNPGLDCFEPIKAGRSLCIERNATFAFTVPRCLQYSMLSAQDTCESLLLQSMNLIGNKNTGAEVVTAASWVGLYRNNPGLICPRNTPASNPTNASTQVCLKADYESINTNTCKVGRLKVVSPMLTCQD